VSSLPYAPTGFVCNLQQKKITFLYRITLLVFIMETGGIYCVAQFGSFKYVQFNIRL